MYAVLVICAVSSAIAETPFKPTAVHRGAQSQVVKRRFQLIEHETAWKKLWADHRGKGATPDFKVDFDKHCVACLFFGPHLIVPTIHQKSTRSIPAIRIRFNDSVQFRPEPYGQEPKWLHPYLFVVFDRSSMAVVIEKDVRGLIGDPPKWKELARFPIQKSK